MIFFHIREAFKSISRAKASFILTFISLGIAVVLIIASVAAIQLSNLLEKKLKDNINLNIFIKENTNANEIQTFKKELENFKSIKSVNFISKDEAAETFIKETGEDFREILSYNPLPASFVVTLNFDEVAYDSLHLVADHIASLEWVDEVVFKDSFVYKVFDYIDKSKLYLAIVTVLVFLVALYLVYTTIRLITNARMRELETMKLVGAKLSTIKIPIILNGIVAGLLSGILAFVAFWFLFTKISSFRIIVDLIEQHGYLYILLLFVTGPTLSFLVTVYALRKITLKI
ncbi:MAG TPA: permease-like cell division protein FtsX [Ignavibacteriaceae bacterium]|nr:permease-like cell division protein FtsX [Ignavibacteriaceae bacterium]